MCMCVKADYKWISMKIGNCAARDISQVSTYCIFIMAHYLFCNLSLQLWGKKVFIQTVQGIKNCIHCFILITSVKRYLLINVYFISVIKNLILFTDWCRRRESEKTILLLLRALEGYRKKTLQFKMQKIQFCLNKFLALINVKII